MISRREVLAPGQSGRGVPPEGPSALAKVSRGVVGDGTIS